MDRQWLSYTLLLVSIFLVVGCSAPATPVPSTPVPEATRPGFTDGTNQWHLSSVSFTDTFENSGEAVVPSDPSQTFLRIDFECSPGASLINLYAGSSFQSTAFTVPGGVPDVFVTDEAGEQYLAVRIETCRVVVPVSRDGHGFTLHFKDLQPIELGK